LFVKLSVSRIHHPASPGSDGNVIFEGPVLDQPSYLNW
jgi:hypothetical protein